MKERRGEGLGELEGLPLGKWAQGGGCGGAGGRPLGRRSGEVEVD
jgi:hypothetical protein